MGSSLFPAVEIMRTSRAISMVDLDCNDLMMTNVVNPRMNLQFSRLHTVTVVISVLVTSATSQVFQLATRVGHGSPDLEIRVWLKNAQDSRYPYGTSIFSWWITLSHTLYNVYIYIYTHVCMLFFYLLLLCQSISHFPFSRGLWPSLSL